MKVVRCLNKYRQLYRTQKSVFCRSGKLTDTGTSAQDPSQSKLAAKDAFIRHKEDESLYTLSESWSGVCDVERSVIVIS